MKRIALRLSCLLAPILVGSVTGAQGRPGSIYRPDLGPVNMIADRTARRPGDLVTVLITEQQNIKTEEQSQLKRGTTLDYSLNTFNIKPNAFNPLPDINATSQDDFTGKANYEKKGNFTARITAIVMDVLPNGNMVILGRREIRIDRETKVIEFSGIVRRFDVSADNTIESELVADARVSYVGTGDLTTTTNRNGLGGWFHRAIVWLWPF
ncbi:MAG TPA: flagellar basal body L-ring protein FlgH [Planctomycetes bacterium]|nr:flagellar basal body L-ring protein FlgH [Planctomycetota bacterium]